MKKTIIPRSYSDISLGQFLDWNNTQNEFEKFCIMTGVSEEDAKKIAFIEVKQTIDFIQNVLDNKNTSEYKMRFDLNGKSYGMIPDISTISYGEFADLMHYTKKENINQELDKAMAVLYRPVNATMGTKYDIEVYNASKHVQNASDMRELRLDYVFGVLLFFSSIAKDLLQDSLTYLEQQTKELLKETEQLKEDLSR